MKKVDTPKVKTQSTDLGPASKNPEYETFVRFGNLLVPGAIILAIVGAAIFFANRGSREPNKTSDTALSPTDRGPKIIVVAPASIIASPETGDAIQQLLLQIKNKIAGFAS